MNSGDYLYLARHQAGLTQKELAHKAGCVQHEISRIERGHVQPSFERLRSLVHACGLDIHCSFSTADHSYISHTQECLALSPSMRVAQGLDLARKVQRFQEAGEG